VIIHLITSVGSKYSFTQFECTVCGNSDDCMIPTLLYIHARALVPARPPMDQNILPSAKTLDVVRFDLSRRLQLDGNHGPRSDNFFAFLAVRKTLRLTGREFYE